MRRALLTLAARAPEPPVSGYQAWWDFSNESSVTVVSGGISQINDLSPSGGYHLTQSNSALRPTHVTSAELGGSALKHMRGDGSINLMGLGRADSCGLSDDFTVLIACRKQTATRTGTNNDPLWKIRGTEMGVLLSGATYFAFYDGSGGFNFGTQTSTDWTNPRVHTYSAISATTTHIHYVNKTAVKTSTTGAPAASVTNLGAFRMAAVDCNADWDIGEVVVYPSTLSQSDRESVIDYLIAKWSLTA